MASLRCLNLAMMFITRSILYIYKMIYDTAIQKVLIHNI